MTAVAPSPGQTLESSRTVTEDDIARCAALTGDYGAHHIAGLAGRPIAQGLLTAAAAPLLRQDDGFRLREMTLVFRQPVFAGDTVHAQVQVTSVEQDGPGLPVMRFGLVIRNQDGTEVITGEGSGAFAGAPAGAPADSPTEPAP